MAFKASKLEDKTEKMWVLGTDIVEESDLDVMENGTNATFTRPEGNVYYIPDLFEYPDKFKLYSKTFNSIAKEALKRNYVWLMFDRDVESSMKN